MMVVCTLQPPEKGEPDNMKAQGLFSITTATDRKEIGYAMWRKYVPEALQMKDCKPNPIQL
jgi:hypothetical protein